MKGVDIMTYWVILGITIIARVTGMEAAYEVYHKACELAELIGSNCMLVTEEDEKVITKYNYEEE